MQSDQVLSLPFGVIQSIQVNQEINLTFTYEMGPPSHFVVSGAEVSAFKHRMPEWDKPGSFSIKAKAISPVTSESGNLSLHRHSVLPAGDGGEDFMKAPFLKRM